MNLFLSFIVFVFSVGAFANFPQRDVQWGGMSDSDACGGLAFTMADTVLLTKNNKGHMSFETVLPAGSAVFVCDYESGFYGVVVEEDGTDCETGATVPERTLYNGSCKSGWIKDIFLLLAAG